jgi:hypothetical protein
MKKKSEPTTILYPFDFVDRNLDLLIRSHNHYYAYTEFGSSSVVSPAWKLGDSHLFKGGIYPDIGAVEVIVEPNEEIHIKRHIMPKDRLPKPRIVRI